MDFTFSCIHTPTPIATLVLIHLLDSDISLALDSSTSTPAAEAIVQHGVYGIRGNGDDHTGYAKLFHLLLVGCLCLVTGSVIDGLSVSIVSKIPYAYTET